VTARSLAVNKKGEIAIGHNTGLIIGTEEEFKVYEENEEELQLSVVRGLKYINDDKLMIGYGGGYGNGGFSIKEGELWTHFNRENARIANHMVRDVEVDSDNIYWLATNEGLTYFKDGEVDTIFFREGRMKNTIMDIAIDKNEIWIATNFGVIQIKK
jgi:ligand-binding sensor domain-containing protein